MTDPSGRQLGTADLARGSASVDLPADLPVGTRTLTATYDGDQTNAVSSTTFTATVKAAPGEPAAAEKAASKATVKVKPGKPRFARSFRVVVGVRATGADAVGKVALRIDGRLVATRRLADGRLVFKVNRTLAVGKHRLTVSYAGSRTVQESKASTGFRVRR